MAQLTILEKIQKNHDNCLDNPSILSEYLVLLCSHIIQAENAKVAADIKYARKWAELRVHLESDKRADMESKLQPEYIETKAAEAMSKTLIETIRAIKKRLSFLAMDFNENLSNNIYQQ